MCVYKFHSKTTILAYILHTHMLSEFFCLFKCNHVLHMPKFIVDKIIRTAVFPLLKGAAQ